MVQPARQLIVKGLRYVPRCRAFAPGEVLRAIVPALHGDAILHGAHQRAEIAAHAVLVDDARDAVRGIAG